MFFEGKVNESNRSERGCDSPGAALSAGAGARTQAGTDLTTGHGTGMSACLPRSRSDNSDGDPDADDASGPIPHSNGGIRDSKTD